VPTRLRSIGGVPWRVLGPPTSKYKYTSTPAIYSMCASKLIQHLFNPLKSTPTKDYLSTAAQKANPQMIKLFKHNLHPTLSNGTAPPSIPSDLSASQQAYTAASAPLHGEALMPLRGLSLSSPSASKVSVFSAKWDDG